MANKPREKQIRGHIKNQLLREIAGGTKYSILAKRFGVTTARISQIKRENEDIIEEIQADLDDEMAGLWIAKKSKRIAEYQADIELINKTIEEEGYDAQDFRIKQNAMRSVAEEMGHLPTRVSLGGEVKQVHYLIDGVNPDDVT